MGIFWSDDGSQDVPDPVTGLTPRHKKAIKANWAIIHKDLKGHGVEFFLTLFTLYPHTQEKFPKLSGKSEEELRKSLFLKAHGSNFMHAVSNIVENIDDSDMVVALGEKVGSTHKDRNISKQNYLDAGAAYIAYLKKALGNQATPVLIEGWNQMFTALVQVIESTRDQ